MSEKASGIAAKVPTTEGSQVRGLRLPYLPGLDGLRALAVIAVLIYHGGSRWLPGGFLGVEVFFVLSGYLITSLLLAEWWQRGRISLKGFWLRRARRLLPALFLLLLGTLAFAVVFLPDEVAGLRGDVAAAAGYVTNWYLVLSHKSYFETVGRPSLLRHLWSLAVEEQFYLLWPLLFTALMRRWPMRRVLAALLVAVAASSAWMALLYRPDVDPSRVYYGTDTRAAGFLIGAVLAFAWVPGRSQGQVRWWMLDAIGFGGLAALVALFLRLGEFEPMLYRGGFAAVALATGLVIAVAAHSKARLLPRLLGWGPLRWIGTRSYGIYLWHWPVFMTTRPQLDVSINGLPLLALRLALTGVLAEFSYRCVETPIRTGELGRAWRVLREAHGAQRRWLGLRWAASALGVVTLVIALGGPVVSAQPPAPPAYLAVASIDTLVVAEKPAEVIGPGEASEPKAPWGHFAVPSATPVAPITVSTSPEVPVPMPAVEAGPMPTNAAATQETITPKAMATASPVPEAAPGEASQSNGTSSHFADGPNAAWSGEPELIMPVTSLTAPSMQAEPPTVITPQPTMVVIATRVEPTVVATPVPALPMKTPGPLPTLVPNRVSAIGDSVMLGTVDALTRTLGSLDISASLGRQPWTAAELLQTRREAGQLGAIVVIHLGNNGIFSSKNFNDIMGVLADAQLVVFINVKVPRPWESATNTTLAEGVKRYPNAVLVDWYAASADRPELFWEDGMHIRPAGAQVYAELVAAAIKTSIARASRPTH